MDWGVHPLRELGVVCVPGALAHRHLAARDALPVRVVHADKRGVVRGLVFTGRRGRGSGPGAGGASRGEAVGSAGVQACYGHHLQKIRNGKLNTLELRNLNVFYWRDQNNKNFAVGNEVNCTHVCVTVSKASGRKLVIRCGTGEGVTWCCMRCSGRAVR